MNDSIRVWVDDNVRALQQVADSRASTLGYVLAVNRDIIDTDARRRFVVDDRDEDFVVAMSELLMRISKIDPDFVRGGLAVIVDLLAGRLDTASLRIKEPIGAGS